MYKRPRLDGDNYHGHEQYHTKHLGLTSPPICVLGASLCKQMHYMPDCTVLSEPDKRHVFKKWVLKCTARSLNVHRAINKTQK